MFNINQEIKVLSHCGYGMYGCSIPKYVYDFVKNNNPNLADEMFKIGYGDIMLTDSSDESRFNTVLIEAFESLINEIDNNDDVAEEYRDLRYCVEELYIELDYDYYDGKESNFRIIGR